MSKYKDKINSQNIFTTHIGLENDYKVLKVYFASDESIDELYFHSKDCVPEPIRITSEKLVE